LGAGPRFTALALVLAPGVAFGPCAPVPGSLVSPTASRTNQIVPAASTMTARLAAIARIIAPRGARRGAGGGGAAHGFACGRPVQAAPGSPEIGMPVFVLSPLR
jgi:hypothetical protein